MTPKGVEYEVEEVLDSRMRRGVLQYLVKWMGYPREENSWVPERNMRNAKKKTQEFHRRFPAAPRRMVDDMGTDTTPAQREERCGNRRKWTNDRHACRRDNQRHTNGCCAH